jgi:hypothetical protein
MRLRNDLSPIQHLKSFLSTKNQKSKKQINNEKLDSNDYNYLNTFQNLDNFEQRKDVL